MSYSSNVANFLEAPPSELSSVNMADLELIVGDVMERVRSHSNSPISSRDASPDRLHSVSSVDPPSSSAESDYSEDEYIDSYDMPPQSKKLVANGLLNDSLYNGYIPGTEHVSKTIPKTTLRIDDINISKEISQTVQALKLDIENLTSKINALERGNYSVRRKNMFFKSFTPQMFVFVILWPFLASFIMHKFLHKN